MTKQCSLIIFNTKYCMISQHVFKIKKEDLKQLYKLENILWRMV